MTPSRQHQSTEISFSTVLQLLTLVSLLGTISTGLLYIARRDAKFEPIERNITEIKAAIDQINSKLDSVITKTLEHDGELRWLRSDLNSIKTRVPAG